MGQKVSPIGLRIGINKGWSSNWFAKDKDYANLVAQDIEIRKSLLNHLPKLYIEKITIDRTGHVINVGIYTSRVGLIHDKDNEKIKTLKVLIQKAIKNRNKKIFINVFEIRNPVLSAQIVANQIAHQIANRQSFRIVQKKMITSTLKAGALGIKTAVSGRLGGADMARKEGYSRGKIPLATFRSNIDYAKAEADTKYGKTGVKVWICKKTTTNKKDRNVNLYRKNRPNFKKNANYKGNRFENSRSGSYNRQQNRSPDTRRNQYQTKSVKTEK